MLPLSPSPSSPFENPSPSSSPPPPPAQQQSTDEKGPEIAEAGEGQPVTSTRITLASAVTSPEYQRKLNWPKLIITSCMASAFVIAFQTQYSHFPPTVIFISLAFSISFLCILVHNSISSGFPILAKVLEGLAIFFMVQCFLLAITSLFPPMLKYTIWALYAFSFLLVLIFKLLKTSTTIYISWP